MLTLRIEVLLPFEDHWYPLCNHSQENPTNSCNFCSQKQLFLVHIHVKTLNSNRRTCDDCMNQKINPIGQSGCNLLKQGIFHHIPVGVFLRLDKNQHRLAFRLVIMPPKGSQSRKKTLKIVVYTSDRNSSIGNNSIRISIRIKDGYFIALNLIFERSCGTINIVSRSFQQKLCQL